MASEVKYNKTWLRHRTWTFVAFCIMSFGIGSEMAMVIPSAMFYIENFISTDHPNLFFGLTLSAYSLGSVVGSSLFGSYADKSRNIRRIILLSILCEMTGNFIYAIYLSPWCPVIGRLMSGLGDVINMVMISEIARCYEQDGVTARISWIVTFYSIGFTVSPGLNIFINKINFNIGSFHIKYGNAPGIILALMFAAIFIMAFLMVSDLSKEFDLKEEQTAFLAEEDEGNHKNEQENNLKGGELDRNEDQKALLDEGDEETDENGHENNWNGVSAILKMVKFPDVLLLMSLTFTAGFILFSFDIYISMIGLHYFGLGVKFTSAIAFCNGLVYTLFLYFLAKMSKRIVDYYLILVMFTVLFTGLVAVLVLAIDHSNRIANFILFSLFVFAICTCWCVEEVLTRSLLSKLIPSRCQSTAEGFRRSVSCISFVISGIISAALFDYLEYLASVLCAVAVVLFVLFLLRKKTLISPQLLFE